MFAARVLIASPCSVTTTASDDDFSMTTNTPGWNRVPTFLLLLAWQACTGSSLRIPGSVCCPFAHAMQPLHRCLSVAADVAPVHQECRKLHQPAQYPCVRRDSGPNAMLQRSLQCSGLAGHEPHCTLAAQRIGIDPWQRKHAQKTLTWLRLPVKESFLCPVSESRELWEIHSLAHVCITEQDQARTRQDAEPNNEGHHPGRGSERRRNQTLRRFTCPDAWAD